MKKLCLYVPRSVKCFKQWEVLNFPLVFSYWLVYLGYFYSFQLYALMPVITVETLTNKHSNWFTKVDSSWDLTGRILFKFSCMYFHSGSAHMHFTSEAVLPTNKDNFVRLQGNKNKMKIHKFKVCYITVIANNF